MTNDEHEHPFYGKEIVRRSEHEYIKDFLKKYKNEKVSDELLGKIWHDLQMEKYAGRISIPFKLAIRRDIYKKYPDVIEVILDTKV